MECPICDKEMMDCVVGDDESSAIYFKNCPDCNIQMTNDGYILAFTGNEGIPSNYKPTKEK